MLAGGADGSGLPQRRGLEDAMTNLSSLLERAAPTTRTTRRSAWTISC